MIFKTLFIFTVMVLVKLLTIITVILYMYGVINLFGFIAGNEFFYKIMALLFIANCFTSCLYVYESWKIEYFRKLTDKKFTKRPILIQLGANIFFFILLFIIALY